MIGLYSANSQAITESPFSFGNALQFDGEDDFVSYNEINLSEGSISFWYKTPNSGGVFILSGDNSNSDNEFEIWPRANRAYIAIKRQGVLNTIKTSSQTINTWHHVFVKLTSTTISLWFDGVASEQSPITLGGNFSIKRFGVSYTSTYSQIIIDEVAIWNNPFDLPAELYNSGNGDYATNYSPNNLQAYWRMNGSDTETTAIDEQGNYNGTLNNFPASGMWVAH